jgi:hypothetical protein
MKYLKMLSLAAVAAMALMAVIGVSSASAVELCKENTGTAACPAAQMYTPEQKITADATSAVLTTSGGFINPIVTCSTSGTIPGSETELTVKSTGGGKEITVKGTITKLTFNNCKDNLGHKCTAAAKGLDYDAELHTTANNKWRLTAFKDTTEGHTGEAGEPGASVSCETLPTCEYHTAKAELNGEGGSAGVAFLEANKIALTGAAFPCPTNATWSAKYTLTSPSPIFPVHEA